MEPFVNEWQAKGPYIFTVMTIEVASAWFRGKANIATYDIHELSGTELGALYQRKKGHDLFEQWQAIMQKDIVTDMITGIWKNTCKAEKLFHRLTF